MKIRIAVAVDSTGTWNSVGWGGPDSSDTDGDKMSLAVDPLADGEARYWIEADIALPTDATLIDAIVIKA